MAMPREKPIATEAETVISRQSTILPSNHARTTLLLPGYPPKKRGSPAFAPPLVSLCFRLYTSAIPPGQAGPARS